MEGQIKGLVIGIVFLIVGFVVVFYIVGALAPTLTTAAGNISGSGLYLILIYGIAMTSRTIIRLWRSADDNFYGGNIHSFIGCCI